MAIFEGAGVAIVTPMRADGSVNFEELERLIDFQIENGTDAIIICGTTGESSVLSDDEHMECFRVAVDRVKGRVPVIAGSGSNCTESAIHYSKEAQKYGADAVLLVTPYYNKATQNGLKAHYSAIAAAIDLPVILYNVPSRTGCNILPATAVSLAKEVDNIVAIKEACGNISQVAELARLGEGCIDIYSGNDDQVVPLLSLGAKGVISVLSNIAPRQTHDMVEMYLKGDVEGSRKLQLKALPLVDKLFCEVNPIPVKMALNLMGFEAGTLRLPLTEMEAAHAAELREEMIRFGLEVK